MIAKTVKMFDKVHVIHYLKLAFQGLHSIVAEDATKNFMLGVALEHDTLSHQWYDKEVNLLAIHGFGEVIKIFLEYASDVTVEH